MKEIRIGPKTQVLAVLAVLSAIAAAVGSQVPELRRYLKIEAM
jgi:hypothetical protein